MKRKQPYRFREPMEKRRRYPKHLKQDAEPADRTVTTLLGDVTLARVSEQRIRDGQLDKRHLDMVRDLERRAWSHLNGYLNARAFAAVKRPRERTAKGSRG